MAEDALFTGIDIGSSSVRIAVGQRLPSSEKEQLHIIGAAEVVSEGINRGTINSIEDAVSSVSACIEKVERMTGAPITSAWVSISGSNVTLMESKGVVAVAKSDGEIREDDVDRVVGAAETVATPVNYEILHVIPKSFTVDAQKGIKDPVGMNGLRLEVDAQIIQGLTSHIKNLSKCVYRTGITMERPVLGVLATADVTTTSRQKELGVAVINMGGSSTTMVVFEQGDILHMASIPLGSDHITSDIAIGLRTTIDIAERVKLQYAEASCANIGRSEQINLREIGSADDELVGRKYVCEIVQARVEEIMERIEKELKKIGRAGMLPAGVVLTGGGAKLSGLVEMTKSKLRLPASLGYPLSVTSITDRVNDLAFTTAIGLVQWGMHEVPEGPKKRGSVNVGKQMEAVSASFKKLFGGFRR
jgi:cell division protein FtsA